LSDHFIYIYICNNANTIILPRQARDSHSKTSPKTTTPPSINTGVFQLILNEMMPQTVTKRVFWRHVYIKMHHFTKTGSGQT
jgi:hypothetical protein